MNAEQSRRYIIDLGEVRRALHRCDRSEERAEITARRGIAERRDVAIFECHLLVGHGTDKAQSVSGSVLLSDFDAAETGLYEKIDLFDGVVAILVVRLRIVIEEKVAARANDHAIVEDALRLDIGQHERTRARVVISARGGRTRRLMRAEQRPRGNTPEADRRIVEFPTWR